MLDIKFIRNNPDIVKQAAKNKNTEVDVDRLLKFDEKRRELQGKIDDINKERNLLSDVKGKPSPDIIEKGKKLKDEHATMEAELKTVEPELQELLYKVPNIPTDDTPIGKSEEENQVIKEWGEKPTFDFKPKEHWELGEALGIIDTESAAAVAGTRFAYLKGDLVLLQFALLHHALSLFVKEGFKPVLPPDMLRTDVYKKTARLNEEEITYRIGNEENLWLAASAEHTMVPMHMDKVLAEKDFPIRYIGYSTAFRREAGTYGKDMKGILRVNQFDKLEMESFSTPEQGRGEHDFFVTMQELLMQSLGIPYRVLLKCTADIGNANARGVDIEAWLPGQNKYRETHTADYMADYQARRLNTRVRRADGSIDFVHTNDATACAMGRTLIAIMENYQQPDGSIKIPEVLKPWMFDISEIVRK